MPYICLRMSRNRGRRLVELCKETTAQLINHENITYGEMQDCYQERVSSPARDNEIITPEFMAMFEDVFQEPIDQNENSFSRQLISPAHSTQCQVIKDVNIHTATEADSTMQSFSPNLVSSIEKPSPITLTPQSVEPLFSRSVENYAADNNEELAVPLNLCSPENCENDTDYTPMPSPHCDFSDCSDNADETLVQSTNLEDLTLTPENGNKEDISTDKPLHTIPNDDNSELCDVNPLSVATSLISTECSTFESETSTPKSKRKSKKRSDVGRKRNIHVENWVATKRKRLCNFGQEYTSKRGSLKKAREMKASCTNNCRLKCSTTFTEKIRSELFSNFWGTGNHVMQWQIISKYVFKKIKKSCTNLENVNVRRLHTLHYHLPIKSNDDEITLKKVCKTMFLNTFSISNDFVYTALQKKLESTDFDNFDGRGRHKHHHRVVTDEMKQSVLDHVNSFAPMESHYVRKNSSIKYLDPSLSFSKMFNMYSKWCTENGYNSKVQTVRQYKDIINDNLKIGFRVPKKDQCDLCHQFKNSPRVSDEQLQKYEKHQKEKEFSRKLKQEHKLKAANDNKIACIVFDFQKVLNAPHGNISIYYYRRKLNVYNFTVYDMASKEAYCYMWDETIAKRGPNEVASCLYDFMCKLTSKGVTEVYFWSDNCGGQNRNRIVFYMYLLAASKLKIKVCHRFMEKGHTQNEGDSVHALIEKSAKGKEIYSPDEWYSLVRWAKANGKPYTVIEVKQDMIQDFKKGISAKNWTKNFCNDKVSWNKIKEVQVSPETDGVLSYKYSLGNDERQQIQCFKKLCTRQARLEPLPQKAYENILPISKAKYKDLVHFCDNNIVPQKYHNFFKNLPVTEVHETDKSDEEN